MLQMKFIRYSRFKGFDVSGIDLGGLMDALSNQILDSGFNEDYWWTREMNEPDDSLDALRRATETSYFKAQDAVWVKLVIPTAPKGVGRDQFVRDVHAFPHLDARAGDGIEFHVAHGDQPVDAAHADAMLPMHR